MKNIIIAIAAATLLAVPAYAESIDAVYNGSELQTEQRDGMGDYLVIACYDKDGRLTYAAHTKAENGNYHIALPKAYDTVRAYDMEKNMYDVNITAPSPTVSAEPTLAPEKTEPPKKYVHPAYENETDQVTAFAVVEKVSYAVNAYGEDVYRITSLIQNQRVDVEVENDVVIKSAPDILKGLEGAALSALKEGDAIYYETTLAGDRVKAVDLIYRPAAFSNESLMKSFTSDGSAAGLWSAAQFGHKIPSDRYVYAFGIITDRAGDTITLYPSSGSEKEALNIDYTKNTVTYVYDIETGDPPEIANSSAITKSAIPKAAYDDYDNITYSSDYDYSLALVRMVEGTAADIIIYKNIKFKD